MESVKNGDKQADLMRKIKDLMEKKKAETETDTNSDTKDIDNLKSKIDMMNKTNESTESSGTTKNELSQMLMYFMQNPQQLSVVIDRLQGMVDNVTDKFDPTNFFKRRKPYDMKKGYIVMNLVLKYMDLLELMQMKYDENLNLKCQNGLLDLTIDGEYFNNHLNKLWNMMKLILVEISRLRIDGLKASLSCNEDIKFESPQLFVQPQKSYQDLLECIGFKQDENGKLDLSKIYYPEEAKNLIIDSIYCAQLATILALRNYLNNKYIDFADLIKNSFFSGSSGAKYLLLWENIYKALMMKISSKIIYALTTNTTSRSKIENDTFDPLNITYLTELSTSDKDKVNLLKPEEINAIKQIIKAEDDLNKSITFQMIYDSIKSIEKTAFQFVNIRMKKDCKNSSGLTTSIYILGFKYSNPSSVGESNIIASDRATKLVGSLFVLENLELASGEKNLLLSITKKIIETMDTTDLSDNLMDPFDVLVKIKMYKKTSLKIPFTLTNPIQDLDIDLIDNKFNIKRSVFIDVLENYIFDCYGDILKNYYSTSDKDEFAGNIFLKADNIVLESRRIKLIKFLKQFKSDINLSISFFYKVAETYNATVRPENLVGCPQMLQHKPTNQFCPTPQFEFPTSCKDDEPPKHEDPKCDNKSDFGSKFYSGSKSGYN